MRVESATESDFNDIKKYINLFELDNRFLEINQFLVSKTDNKLLGFVRLRTHSDCCELASLGVIIEERGNGVSNSLVQGIIRLATKPLYLVCIIPEFFKPLGFEVVSEFPEAMNDKLNYCVTDLAVPEEYVVMKYVNTV